MIPYSYGGRPYSHEPIESDLDRIAESHAQKWQGRLTFAVNSLGENSVQFAEGKSNARPYLEVTSCGKQLYTVILHTPSSRKKSWGYQQNNELKMGILDTQDRTFRLGSFSLPKNREKVHELLEEVLEHDFGYRIN